MIDLDNWLSGRYRIPAQRSDVDAEAEEPASSEGTHHAEAKLD